MPYKQLHRAKVMLRPFPQNDIFDINSPFKDMESTLIVKNFGPIKSVELNLRNVNVFIGAQSTGKSALAKLFTIFKSPRKFLYKKADESGGIQFEDSTASKELIEVFYEFNINSFLNPETQIEFVSHIHKITLKKGSLSYEPKFLKEINKIEVLAKNFDKNRKEISSKFISLENKFVYFKIRANRVLYGKIKEGIIDNNWSVKLQEDNCSELLEILKAIENELSTSSAIYIPAERNFINIIRKFSMSLILNKVPIPKHILSFGAELERQDVKELDLNFIQKGLKYKNVNGEERIYIDDDINMMLSEAASGIQSLVPLLASVAKTAHATHRSYVIEEPELNLFPIAQYELIKFLESKRDDPYKDWEDAGTIHTFTTHSPYILSSLNNLLYAHKAYSKLNSNETDPIRDYREFHTKNKKIVENIVSAMIDPRSFTAYQISEGYAESIFDEESGLIKENYIDSASDKLDDDFSELMELLK